MTFSLSKKSVSKLQGVHPDLVKVVKKAIKISEVDFLVSCGIRTIEEQKELYAQGRTKPGKIVTWSMRSQHLIQSTGYGHAVDLIALEGGNVTWEWPFYYVIADAMQQAADEENVQIEWGGNFEKNKDGPHFQLAIGAYNNIA